MITKGPGHLAINFDLEEGSNRSTLSPGVNCLHLNPGPVANYRVTTGPVCEVLLSGPGHIESHFNLGPDHPPSFLKAPPTPLMVSCQTAVQREKIHWRPGGPPALQTTEGLANYPNYGRPCAQTYVSWTSKSHSDAQPNCRSEDVTHWSE